MTEHNMYPWNKSIIRLYDRYTMGVTSEAEGTYYPRTPGLTKLTMVPDILSK